MAFNRINTMKTTIEPLAECGALVAELAGALGVKNIKDLPGPWVYRWGDWVVAANGTEVHQKVELGPHEMGIEKLAPYHMAAWHKGWLLGLFTPFHGTFMGEDGKGEDMFIAAIKEHISEVSK